MTTCQCEACRGGVLHASDCAVHNDFTLPKGPCDCGALSNPTDADLIARRHNAIEALRAGRLISGNDQLLVAGWLIEDARRLTALSAENERLQGHVQILSDREHICFDGEPLVTSGAALMEILHWRDEAESAKASLAAVKAERDSANARAVLSWKLFDQREERLSHLDAENARLTAELAEAVRENERLDKAAQDWIVRSDANGERALSAEARAEAMRKALEEIVAEKLRYTDSSAAMHKRLTNIARAALEAK